MNTRIIPITVQDEYVIGAGVPVGSAGSGKDISLEITFSESWSEYSKRINWVDSRGGNATLTLLTDNLRKPGETNVYIVPIPYGPKTYQGNMTVTIQGYVLEDDEIEQIQVSTTATFKVLPADWRLDDDESVDPTVAEQLQTAIEAKQDILTFDDTPTEDSENPVTSGGIYDFVMEGTAAVDKVAIFDYEEASESLYNRIYEAYVTSGKAVFLRRDTGSGQSVVDELYVLAEFHSWSDALSGKHFRFTRVNRVTTGGGNTGVEASMRELVCYKPSGSSAWTYEWRYATKLAASNDSPDFTGTPMTPNISVGDTGRKIANKNYVDAETTRAMAAEATKQDLLTFDNIPTNGSSNPVKSGGVYSAIADEATRAQAAEALLAPLASPELTGTPTAPTPASGTDNGQIATTEFVNDAIIDAEDIEIISYATATSSLWSKIDSAYKAGKIVFLKRDLTVVGIYLTLQLTNYNQVWSSGSHLAGEGYTFSVMDDKDHLYAFQIYKDIDAGTYSWVNKSGTLATKTYVDTELEGKQDTLTFDDVPTDGSDNPVKSNGIYDALALKASAEELEEVEEQADTAYETALKAFATDTAEGAIVSFPDGADNVPLKSAVLKGKTAAVNQLANPTNGATTDLSFTVSDGVLTINGTTVNANYKTISASGYKTIIGHKYYVGADHTLSADEGLYVYNDGGGIVCGYNNKEIIGTATAEKPFYIVFASGKTFSNTTLRVMIIDLTLCGFTSEETADVATLKAAWLAKYGVPLPQYIPYNAGSIVSNDATYQLTGKNLFAQPDGTNTFSGVTEKWENGILTLTASSATGEISSGAANWKNAGYCTLKAGAYKGKITRGDGTSSGSISVALINQVSGERVVTGISWDTEFTLTLEQNTRVCVAFYLYQFLSTGGKAINVCIVMDGQDSTYEPFRNGGSIVADSLNGFDGTDVFDTQSLTERRRMCGKVDLGTLNWTYQSDYAYFEASINTGKFSDNILSSVYVYGGKNYTRSDMGSAPNMTMYSRTQGQTYLILFVKNTAYTDAATFKTAMSGVYLVYELATPTTDTTTPASLTTQKGYNILRTVSGDVQSGDATLEYRADTALYVQKKIAEATEE